MNEITENNQQQIETMKASAPQTLTETSTTSLHQTPTLSYGEVGDTFSVKSDTIPYRARGVGHFEQTRLLERMCLIQNVTWTTSSTGQLYVVDLNAALYNLARNNPIITQFYLLRGGLEVNIRINSTQFYYGALMATVWPTGGTGQRLDERAVLTPTIISANTANATVKDYKYSYPHAWWTLADVSSSTVPVWLSLDVLAPLTTASANAADSISVQIWARYTDVELSYPGGTLAEAQSNSGPMPKTKVLKKGTTKHILDDIDASSVLMDVYNSYVAPEMPSSSQGLVDTICNWAPTILGAASLLLDKPDKTDSQTVVIQEPAIDMYAADIEDTNVSLSLYKQRYVDPDLGRMPSGRGMTVSDYARIPGLREPAFTFTAVNQTHIVSLLQIHPDNTSYKIPFDYAYLASCFWRGGVKVMLQFFTSSFISTRIAVQLYSSAIGSAPADYTSGISRVVDVKGDTVDMFTFPYLSNHFWSNTLDPTLQFTVISDIVATDTTISPKIYMLVWVAGAEDIQFSYPKVVNPVYWGTAPGDLEAQSMIGSMFLDTFPPVGEGVRFETDTGLCTNEVLGPIADICKRYSPLIPTGISTAVPYQPGVNYNMLDLVPYSVSTHSVDYSNWWRFRGSLFGTWRQAFLYRSGGYRYRCFQTPSEKTTWSLSIQGNNVAGTYYFTPTDNVTRVTVPQVGWFPYAYLGNTSTSYFPGMSFFPQTPLSTNDVEFIAARDDLQLGFPILPSAAPPATLLEEEFEKIEKKTMKSSLSKTPLVGYAYPRGH